MDARHRAALNQAQMSPNQLNWSQIGLELACLHLHRYFYLCIRYAKANSRYNVRAEVESTRPEAVPGEGTVMRSARRSDRPKRRTVALRASVGSTDAPERNFRGSMPFCTGVTLEA